MDIRTLISELRSKINIDKSKLLYPNIENEGKICISKQDDLPSSLSVRNHIADGCGNGYNHKSQKLCKKKKEKPTSYLAPTCTQNLPLREIDKNVSHPVTDIRELEKEKLRQVLIYSDEYVFSDPKPVNKNEKRMVRYGEYSPRHPNIIPSDRPLLALGEYEERRRLLLEQKKKEYMEQMNQVRLNFQPLKKDVHDNEETFFMNYMTKNDSPSSETLLVNHMTKNDNPRSGRVFANHMTKTASPSTGTQTEEPTPVRQKEMVRSPLSDDNHSFPINLHESNSKATTPLSLTVPDDPFQIPKFQSLSPRERKLADLRGSENYSPSFYSINYREGADNVGSLGLPLFQPEDQQLNARMRHQQYQEELRKQIEEKKKLEALQKEKERREEEMIMKRVKEQQERMRLEYEQEKAQRQIRQVQRLHIAEEFQRRQEELEWEAQQIREEEMKRKRGVVESRVQEVERNENVVGVGSKLEQNQGTNFGTFSSSLPVPALRTKLLNEVNSLYQSPKEVTQILDNNFSRTLNQSPATPRPLHKANKRNKRHKHKTENVDPPEPVSREPLTHQEHHTEVPILPQSRLESGDIMSEARPSNILTQLGDFRRQMQINHQKMQENLQKKFQEKSSSF